MRFICHCSVPLMLRNLSLLRFQRGRPYAATKFSCAGLRRSGFAKTDGAM
jgi:hypothetical protein